MKLISTILYYFLLLSYNVAQDKPTYYRYEGKLGPRDAVLELANWPKSNTEAEQEIEPISAYYYFKDEGIPILLYKSKTAESNDLVLRTWRDDLQERFVVHYDEKALKGRWYWTEADEGEAIILKGSKLTEKSGFMFLRSQKVVEEEVDPSDEPLKGTIVFSAFLPTDKPAQQSFIQVISKGVFRDFTSYTNAAISSFEKSYKDAVQQFIEGGDTDDSEFMNQFAIYNIYPVMNSDQYLVMMESVYSYSGGAHGMNLALYYNYDKKKGKWLKLGDVFDLSKTLAIEKVLDAELRRQYNIPKGVKLSEAKENDFIADAIQLTENFTLSNYQITFHYQPYELTPYAVGPFELRVPLENFKGMFKDYNK